MAGVACYGYVIGMRCHEKLNEKTKEVEIAFGPERAPQMCGHPVLFVRSPSYILLARIFWASISFLHLLSSTNFSHLI